MLCPQTNTFPFISNPIVTDLLKAIDLNFVGEIKPILIKSSEDETLTQLVLPIRTY